MPAARWRPALTAGALLAATVAGSAAAQTVSGPPTHRGITPVRRQAVEPELMPQPRLVTSPYAATLPPPAATLPPAGEMHPPPEAHVAAPPKSFLARCKHRLQKCFLGFPSEFEAPPLGAMEGQHFDTMVANGEAARMVLYEYDFVPGGQALNCRGRDRVNEIRHLLPRNAFPVVVERTPSCPALAESRRLAVMNELALGPFPVPPERVVVGPPIANGLSGVEAVVIYGNQIRNTQQRGPAIINPMSGQTGGQTGQSGSVPIQP